MANTTGTLISTLFGIANQARYTASMAMDDAGRAKVEADNATTAVSTATTTAARAASDADSAAKQAAASAKAATDLATAQANAELVHQAMRDAWIAADAKKIISTGEVPAGVLVANVAVERIVNLTRAMPDKSYRVDVFRDPTIGADVAIAEVESKRTTTAVTLSLKSPLALSLGTARVHVIASS